MRTTVHNLDGTLQARLTGETDALRQSLGKRMDGHGAEISRLRDRTTAIDKQLDRITGLLEKLSARVAAVEYEVGISPSRAKASIAGSSVRAGSLGSPATAGRSAPGTPLA